MIKLLLLSYQLYQNPPCICPGSIFFIVFALCTSHNNEIKYQGEKFLQLIHVITFYARGGESTLKVHLLNIQFCFNFKFILVVAAPEDYPSTPQASPILTHTLPTVQPPEYSGLKITEQPRSRSSSSTFHGDIEMSTLPLPVTVPAYDAVSESEDEWFPVHTSPGQRPRSKSNLLGENGNPPSYQAVTSEGSDSERIGQPHITTTNPQGIKPRTQNRTSRSKRDSLSLRNNRQQQQHHKKRTLSDSDSDNNEPGDGDDDSAAEIETPPTDELIVPNHELPAISSDSEGEANSKACDSTDTTMRSKSPPLLQTPTNNHLTVFPSDRISSERRPSEVRERSYSELARHALQNSHTQATSPEPSPTIRRSASSKPKQTNRNDVDQIS